MEVEGGEEVGDAHNGYSFVVPFPLVQVELAPAEPSSTSFAGGNDPERTFVHEFAHQISNDRNQGFRGVLRVGRTGGRFEMSFQLQRLLNFGSVGLCLLPDPRNDAIFVSTNRLHPFRNVEPACPGKLANCLGESQPPGPCNCCAGSGGNR